jgi:hypothetical protein
MQQQGWRGYLWQTEREALATGKMRSKAKVAIANDIARTMLEDREPLPPTADEILCDLYGRPRPGTFDHTEVCGIIDGVLAQTPVVKVEPVGVPARPPFPELAARMLNDAVPVTGRRQMGESKINWSDNLWLFVERRNYIRDNPHTNSKRNPWKHHGGARIRKRYADACMKYVGHWIKALPSIPMSDADRQDLEQLFREMDREGERLRNLGTAMH